MPDTRAGARLSSDEVDEYFDIGWIVRRALFRAAEVAKMRACFDELERAAHALIKTDMHRGSYFVLGERLGQQVIERVVWAGAYQPYLLEIANDARLTAPCAQLLSSETLDHLLSQAHFKRPHDGVRFNWHQDIEHRDKGDGTWTDANGRGSFVQTMTVLDEMTADSGPMLFVPGSSKWGRVELGNDGDRLCREHVTITAQPGDVLFFGPYTAHASFENESERYRRVLINGYACPGANRRHYPGVGVGRRVISRQSPR